jgi:hypothetical protein
MRLIDHGCKVWMGKDKLKHVVKIAGPESYETNDDGKLRAKIIETDVWLVKVTMPRHFIDEVNTEKEEVGNSQVDMDDVSDAYDEDLNSDELAKGNSTDDTDQEIQNQEPQ